MKSILIKVGGFPLSSETFIINHIIMLSELGFDTSILCDKKISYDESIHKKRLKESIPEKLITEYKKYKYSNLKLLNWVIFLVKNFIHLFYVFKLYKLNLDLTLSFEIIEFYKNFRKYDIIHIQYGTNSKPIDSLKQIGFIKSRIITTFHGHDVFFPINGVINDPNYYKILIKQGHLFTANTFYLKQRLLGLGFPDSKIAVVPAPVNTGFFRPLRNDRKVISGSNKIKLLCVGRLVEIKGFNYVIKAVAELKKRNVDFILKIIGDGPQKALLISQIKQYNLSEFITIVPAMSQEFLRDEYINSDIFIMSSITLKEDIKETQGLVTLEAQACGIPVVAFDTGGVRYTLENNVTGLLCKEMDYLDLASKLELLISNPNIRLRMGEKAPFFVEKHFSENLVRKQWQNLLNE